MQELAKLHGGDVKVSSVLGEGTTFIVSIPTGSDHLPKGHIVVASDRPMATKASAIYMEEALRWLPEADGDCPVVVHFSGYGTKGPSGGKHPTGRR